MGLRTLAVVMEVCELVAPLCQNAQRILEEGNNNQEAAYGWEISIQNQVSSIVTWRSSMSPTPATQAPRGSRKLTA